MTDTTEGRRARAMADHQAMLLEHLHDTVISVDERQVITSWNAAAERIHGWSRHEALGHLLVELLPTVYSDGSTHEDVWRRAERGGPIVIELRRQNRSGGWTDVESNVVPLRGPDGTHAGFVLVGRDVSRRRRAELALRASQERFNRILETSNDGVWIVDAGGRTEFVNARAAELFGLQLEEMLGRHFLDLLPPSLLDNGREAAEEISRGASARRELTVPRPDGTVARVVFSRTPLCDQAGQVAGAIALFVDVTEQRRVEEELHQANRLEAVGRLAAGIAHEINTPIQYIGDNTTFIKEAFSAVGAYVARARGLLGGLSAPALAELDRTAGELDLDYLLDRAPGTLERTLEGVERVATIVRAMKEFAHQDQPEMVPADLNRALLATLEVARNEYKYVAEVRTALGDLPLVTCHPGDLNQVFLNLIVNAAHAVADAGRGPGTGGVIEISTAVDGTEAVITVSDTGTGIPEPIRQKIFEPFFTTKEVGRGSGQGLAIAQSVVAKHGGQLQFTSEMGKGTTFRVRLPLTPRPQRAGAE